MGDNMNAKRFQDALFIVDPGASNPSGILYSVLSAIKECDAEEVCPADDPAIRLMIWQCADTLFYIHATEISPEFEHMHDLNEVVTKALGRMSEVRAEGHGGHITTDPLCRQLVAQMAFICRTDILSASYSPVCTNLQQECKERAA